MPALHRGRALQDTRFKRDVIYTYTGPILLALNPFQRLPLYTKEVCVLSLALFVSALPWV